MAEVFLGLGSNIEPRKYINSALATLKHEFGNLSVSPVYESEAVGFDGDNFLNLVVRIETTLTVGELLSAMRNIENNNGRDRSAPRFSGRTLDIDILTYDDLAGVIDTVQLPRDEIFKNAFVLKPFSEIAPDLIIPGTDKTLTELWQAFDKQKQALWGVDLGR